MSLLKRKIRYGRERKIGRQTTENECDREGKGQKGKQTEEKGEEQREKEMEGESAQPANV
jgi:hypothetical protein